MFFLFHIWGQIEAVFNISKFSKWPPFWVRDELFFTRSIMRLWLHLYRYIFMTSLMTSPGHKSDQTLKLIYLRQWSVDQKLKISELLMAIFLVYSSSDITSGEKVCSELQMAAILKNWNIKHSFNLTSDLIRPFQVISSKVFSWWWLHRWRHKVASKFPSIFMCRRCWQQVARAMSCQ